MRRQINQPLQADVLAFWRRRFAVLHDRIIQTPAPEAAWFWQVQWDILNYLLHRYAGDEKQPPPNPKDGLLRWETHKVPGPASMEVSPAGSFAATVAAEGKKPRVWREIRPVLQDVAQGNQERHELLNRMRDSAIQAMRRENQRANERVAKNKAVYDFNTLGGLPTDDEIEEMLLNFIDLDSPPDEHIETK